MSTSQYFLYKDLLLDKKIEKTGVRKAHIKQWCERVGVRERKEEEEGERGEGKKRGSSPRPWMALCSDLKKGLLLLQMFTDERNDVVDLCRGPQFVPSSTPVLISSVLLL